MSRINTNVNSLVGQNQLKRANDSLSTAINRLSTGLRINSGKDDPAGLIASEALRSDIVSTEKAISNSERASLVIATADAALGQVSSLLNDIRGLVVEAANSGALSDDEVAANQLQVDSSLEALNRIAQTTSFQGRKLLDGSLDFVTNASSVGSVRSAQIEQANLGSSGSVGVTVDIASAATRATLAGSIPIASTPGNEATATLTLGGGAQINIEAAATGIDFNNVEVSFVESSSTLPGAPTAAFDTDLNTLVVTVNDAATTAAADIATAINDLADFNATVGVAGNYQNSTDPVAASTSLTFAGGGELTVTSATGGSGGNGISVVFAESASVTTGAPTAAFNGTNQITVTVNNGAATNLSAIQSAIDGLAGFNATVDQAGSYQNSSSAVAATDTVSFADSGSFSVTAATGGTAGNAISVVFTDTNGQGATPSASYNSGTNTVEVLVDDTVNTSVADLVSAIGGLAEVNASVIQAGNYVVANDADGTVATLAGGLNADAGDSALTGSTTGGAGATAGDSNITATTAGGTNDVGAGLISALTFRLSGSSGSEVFSFDAGATGAQIANAVNLLSDATSVSASFNSGTGALSFSSTDYGSDALVQIDVIDEASGGTFESGLTGSRDSGTDIVATINGVKANGKANSLSINTSSLDLSLTVDDGSTTDFSFTISGGGALFQLGPDVVRNQQARLGIGSVDSGSLGGASGRLYQLASGQSADLKSDPTLASKIVDETISKVASLRGRLGAFQSTTLESNISSLNDSIANLRESESVIRDADFAKESANLTRAQILVQSSTSVLGIANQNPQQVLSLLR
ncbi:MAG TPA: flagellin [Pirellulaceae bacterium]|jgi:flagellin|nr:flagellin [Pirellulaceae bacterium]